MLSIKINKKSAKGISLIELLITLGILSMVVGSILLSSYKVSKFCNSLQVDSCNNNILSFIIKSKLYCRNKNNSGDLVFDITNKELRFKVAMKVIYRYELPKSFALKDFTTNSGKNLIHIDNFGFTSDACTIGFRDKYNNLNEITICVGTAYTSIK